MSKPTPGGPVVSVFVSYSHDSADHVDRVLEISNRLRLWGVDANLDQYEQNPATGWQIWMQQQIERADYVLLVCTEAYRNRVEKKEKIGEGLGATWEGQLIYNALYSSQCINQKFVPVVLDNKQASSIPEPLKPFQHYVLDSDDGFLALYRFLTKQPSVSKPELGRLVPLPAKVRKSPSGNESLGRQPEIVTTATFCRTLPAASSQEVIRDGVIRTLRALTNKFDVVILEGTEGSGKTTVLRQLVLKTPNDCIASFFSEDDKSTYDSEHVAEDVVNQARWLLNQGLVSASKSNSDPKTCFQQLNLLAKRRRKPFLIVLDGLGEVLHQIPGGIHAILDILPEPGLEGFKFIASDDTGQLKRQFGGTINVQTFPMMLFGLEETTHLYDGIIADFGIVNELAQICEGNPGLLSSARRLINSGKAIFPLLTMLSKGQSAVEIEWNCHKPFSEIEQRLLAYLAFDNSTYTAEQLSDLVRIDHSEVVITINRFSFLGIKSAAGSICFKANWFRSKARAEFEKYRRSVHKNIAHQLVAQAGSTPNVLDIALHYEESAEYAQVLAHLAPDHISEIVRGAKSFARIQRVFQIALSAARRVDREAETIRFALANATVADFSRIGIAANEVSAWAALKRFDSALGIARASSLKEDRLHLLAIVASAIARNGQKVPPEVCEQISVLARDVDVAILGQRTFTICRELISVLPEIALDLGEKIDTTETGRERMLARLSVLALEAQNGEQPTDVLDKIKARGLKLSLDGIQQALSSISQKWTSEEVLRQAATIERTRDRLYLLRSWATSSDSPDPLGTAIENALNLAITATDYTVDARILRDLAAGLDRVSDPTSLKKLIEIFDAQRGAGSRLGPSLDFVRLQLLLAENELRVDATAAETRLLSLFYDLPQIPELGVRAESLARFLSGLTRICSKAPIGLAAALIEDSTRELEESFVKLLDGTADHYRAAAGVITATAEWDVEKAVEFASMLNTENCRDSILVDITEAIIDNSHDQNTLPIKSVIDMCVDRDLRDQAVAAALTCLARKCDNARGLTTVQYLDWLYENAKRIRSATRRTRAICCLYRVAARLGDSTLSLDQLSSDLLDAWGAISSGHVRVKHGFRIVRTLAASAPSLAQIYLESTQALKKEIGGLSSDRASSVYIHSVRLAARAFSGLVKRQNDTQRDLDLLAIQIDRVPSPGERALLWADLVLLCYKRRAQQKGQCGSWVRRKRASLIRRVAIEVGLCRSARTRRAAGFEVGRKVWGA